MDHYQVIRKLGAGANAKVKLAIDTRTGTQVALKVMKGDLASIPQRYLAQCQSEIAALNRINHPNIVRIFDVNESALYRSKSGKEFNVVYIAMELLSNGELFDVLFYTGKMEEPIARVYFRQILDAVGSCHAGGITHRDLKPENILFDEHFNLKLADFGFAAPTAGKDGSGFLHTHLGTESYMAPEMFLKQPYSGVSVDLFACGVILFILISQHPAFGKAQQSDRFYNLFLTQNERFWTLHSRNKPQGFYSAEFKELINGMLAFNPAQRPTVQQILECRWINGESLSMEDAQREIAQRHAQAQQKKALESQRTAVMNTRAGQYRGALGESVGNPMMDISGSSGFSMTSSAGVKTLLPFIGGTNKFTRVYTNLRAERIMYLLNAFLKEKEAEVHESDKKFKISAKILTDFDYLVLSAELFDMGDGTLCVELTKTEGPTYEFMKVFEDLKEEVETAMDED